MVKKRKFSQIWTNQTNLGKKFDQSAKEIGKILIKHGLKDPKTEFATKIAIDKKYAKLTPLKNGTIYYMWNHKKVISLLKQSRNLLSRENYWINHVKEILKEANDLLKKGQDKLVYLLADLAYENVPQNILNKVRVKIENSDQT